MYIIAIAWLYVVMLMALTEESIIGGIMSLIFYGVLPLSIFLYVFGTPQRKRYKRQAEQREAASQSDASATPVTKTTSASTVEQTSDQTP
ncbi:hypothetical protein ACMYR3_05805 [Ampullimonas aquatilis]|uniref:hypothetical protein n=1 Tax=Ampullimonas aquatilis TaxID=1341549 RepID=UPI003C759FF2